MKVEDAGLPANFLEVLKKSGIAELNPVQEKTVKKGLLNLDKSFVISAPTASGKTLIAEMMMVTAILTKGCKAIYVVPLKALASEKYESFKKRYAPLGVKVGISTGDLDSSDSWLHKYDLIILTSEKTDSLMRHHTPWINDVGIVVIDEVHLINDPGRGPTLEVTITRLRRINPQIKFLFLSATIKNSKDLAKWIGAELVESDWRPVKLYEGIYDGEKVGFMDKEGFAVSKDYPPEVSIADTTVRQGKQAIIFASTRRNAESIAERASKIVGRSLNAAERVELAELSEHVRKALESPTQQCKRLAKCVASGVAFHHAGLVSSQRSAIENAFRNKSVKIIAATPTLAAGVDLPAYRVILRDMKRYYSTYGHAYIPVLEYEQMCLPYNARVLMADGSLKPIGYIVKKESCEKVLSFDMDSNKTIPRHITNWFVSKDKTIKIFVSGGRNLIATPRHPIMTMPRGSERKLWRASSELRIGDKIGHALDFGYECRKAPYFWTLVPEEDTYLYNGTNLFRMVINKMTRKELARRLGKSTKAIKEYVRGKKAIPLHVILGVCKILGLSESEIARYIKEVKTSYGNIICLPMRLDEKFMWLAGIIATDGSIVRTKDKRTGSTYHHIKLTNTDMRIISRANEILRHLGLSPHIYERNDNAVSLEVGSSLLAKIFEKFGIPSKNKTNNIFVPDFFFSLPRELIGAYLSGVFDGDGNYNVVTDPDFPGTLAHRVLICTASRRYSDGLHNLLLRLGIFSRVEKNSPKPTIIRGKKANFRRPIYNVIFRRGQFITKFSKWADTVKCKIPHVTYKKYHNVDRHFADIGPLMWLEIKKIEKSNKKMTVYNISVDKSQNYFVENFLVHNCGRAGRPRYDKEGESIIIAKNSMEAQELYDRFIMGEPEEIFSKLAVEPILRMHTLALIATGLVKREGDIYNFFAETFYGYQFADMQNLEEKIRVILDELIEWKFVVQTGQDIRPTLIGKRVAELYVDPGTAHSFVEAIEKFTPSFFGVLHLISSSRELGPQLRMREREGPEYAALVSERGADIMGSVPSEWDYEFEHFMDAFKTAMMFDWWCSEFGEAQICEKFGVAPGELNGKRDVADWLLYACNELTLLIGKKDSLKEIRKIRTRVKYGIKEELLALVALKGIGRVRSRTLFDAGLQRIVDLRDAPIEKLEGLLGSAVAKSVKEQLV